MKLPPHNFEPPKDGKFGDDWICTNCGFTIENAEDTCPNAPLSWHAPGTPEHTEAMTKDENKTPGTPGHTVSLDGSGVVSKPDEQLVGLLTLLTTMFERMTDAAERIATALEAQLELETKAEDPQHITADDVRRARRDLLLAYSDELGVAEWGEEMAVDTAKASNDDLRRWCLDMIAGETLVPF